MKTIKILLITLFIITLKESNAQSMHVEKIRPNTSVILTCVGPAPPYDGEVAGGHAVDEKGYILIKHIGKLYAAGKTPVQLGNTIASTLISRGIYTKCQISVTLPHVMEGNTTITLLGAINSNSLPYKAGLTLSEAIAKAGGLNQWAKRSKEIVITRKGAKKPIKVSLKDIERKKRKDILLRPDDIIEVLKRKF